MEASSGIAPADDVLPVDAEKSAEKSTEERLEQNEATDKPISQIPAIDPVIEKRVVRKLDARVPVLTAFLCMFVTVRALRWLVAY